MNSPLNRYLKTINDVEERIKVLEKNNLKNLVNNHNYRNIPYQNWGKNLLIGKESNINI